MNFVRDGWPDERKLTPQSEEIELFGRRKADLTILKDCLITTNGHESLAILNESFHLPITTPNVGIVGQDLKPRPDPINEEHQDEIEPEQARRSPTPPQQAPRRSGRNCRAPDRYSPG
ncbi:hypothetical protein niasHS_001837 [Heterodera schachtii]|uniref:Uncharacterized protein n=1 Tax=Heterodera schachtii TaxID=97005 RepID=A0ABD2KAK4_HETSC